MSDLNWWSSSGETNTFRSAHNSKLGFSSYFVGHHKLSQLFGYKISHCCQRLDFCVVTINNVVDTLNFQGLGLLYKLFFIQLYQSFSLCIQKVLRL